MQKCIPHVSKRPTLTYNWVNIVIIKNAIILYIIIVLLICVLSWIVTHVHLHSFNTNVVSSNPARAWCTRYNIMWKSLSVTCDLWLQRYIWNIVEVALTTIAPLPHSYPFLLIKQVQAYTEQQWNNKMFSVIGLLITIDTCSTRNVREYRRGTQKWTTQRNWQHIVHKTKKKKTKIQHNMRWTPHETS